MSTLPKISLVELDPDGIKDSLKTFLQSQSEFTDYDFEGSALSTLIDLLAMNSHYLAYYQNMAINERFLETAELRKNVVSIAKHLGYTPRSRTSSVAEISITITPNDTPTSIIIPKYTQFSTTLDSVQYTFNTSVANEVIPVLGVYSMDNVNLIEGKHLTYRFTANTADPDQQFIIPNAGIDTETLTVNVQNSVSDTNTDVFTLATDLMTVNANTNYFFLQETDDEKYEVTFGDDIIGKKLIDGNIIITDYLVSNGDEPNKANSFVMVDNVAGYTNVAITTTTAAYGGAAAETMKDIKFSAPKHYETQNRAVTTNDYERIVTADFANVDAVKAYGGDEADPPVYGKVYIALKPKTGYTVTESIKDAIKQDILKKKNIVSITPEIVDPDYIYLQLSTIVKYDSRVTSKSADQLQNEIRTSIDNYSENELTVFDRVFRFSPFQQTIDAVDVSIRGNLSTINLIKRLVPTLGSNTKYTENFSNAFYHPQDGFEGTITSDKFTHSQIANCSLIDNDGVMQIVLIIGAATTVIVSDAGTVDYLTGKIVLSDFSPTLINSTENYIKIYAKPEINDVIPTRNQIVQIDPDDVTVSMSLDEIT